jgi:hypothetical protein
MNKTLRKIETIKTPCSGLRCNHKLCNKPLKEGQEISFLPAAGRNGQARHFCNPRCFENWNTH